MKTIEIQIFSFSELSDKARERARDWFKNGLDPAWGDESLDSIKKFCDRFDVTLTEWSIGARSPIDYRTDATQAHFRGVKLSQFTRDHTPTGYCLDCALWGTFYDVFKATGDAKRAFNDALYAGFKEWRDDLEWQYSDEAVDENIEANNYQFTISGEFWRG